MLSKEHYQPIHLEADSDTALLCVHGFSGTPLTMEYIAKEIYKKNITTYCPLLTGHGTTWQDMNTVSYKTWSKEVEDAYTMLRKSYDKVFIIGLSMGGALAIDVATRTPDIDGLILINNALFFKFDIRLPLLPLLKGIIKSDKAISGDIKAPGVTEDAYDCSPTNAAYELSRLQKKIRKNLDLVTQPALIMKSTEDHVIPKRSSVYTFDHISSKDKRFVWLKNSYHVAPLDNDKDLIVDLTYKFIMAGGNTNGN